MDRNDNADQWLFTFQIGPVQEFIAQARSTRDLWAGSYMLSWLMAHAVKTIVDAEQRVVFPDVGSTPLLKVLNGEAASSKALVPTIPNRLIARIEGDAGSVNALAEACTAAIRLALSNLSEPCWRWMESTCANGTADTAAWQSRWKEQLDRALFITWHSVPCRSDSCWTEDYRWLTREHASRRNTRNFSCWVTDAHQIGAVKDAWSGQAEAIGSGDAWKKLGQTDWMQNTGGPLGALNCIKRLYPFVYLQERLELPERQYWDSVGFQSTRDIAVLNDDKTDRVDPIPDANPRNGYIAVLALDGDNMGAWTEKAGTLEASAALSAKLGTFALDVVPGIVGENGQLIYAGGDDILAMVSATTALTCVRRIREAFQQSVSPEMDLSSGVAIGHYMHPLQDLVNEAQNALHRAKDLRGRSAVEISLLKRGGETLQWGTKWDSHGLELFDEFVKYTDCGSGAGQPRLTGGFASTLASFLAPYKLQEQATLDPSERLPSSFIDVLRAEYCRVQERQCEPPGKIVLEHAGPYLDELASRPETWRDFGELFLAASFIYRRTEA